MFRFKGNREPLKKPPAISHYRDKICDRLKALPLSARKRIQKKVIGIIKKEKKKSMKRDTNIETMAERNYQT